MYKMEITFKISGNKAKALEYLGELLTSLLSILYLTKVNVTGGIVYEMKEEK